MMLGGGQGLALAVLLLLTLYAAAVDVRSLIIPDAVNLALFCSGLTTSLALGIVEPVSALAASVLGAGLLFLVLRLFRAYRGYDGLGLGDVKFAGAAATWIGVESLAFALLAACATALVYILGRRMLDRRFDAQQPVPFAPFLAIGTVAVAAPQIVTGLSIIDVTSTLLPFPPQS